ncbi:hypothetical protein F5Y12DRAFT_580460 [Xylaria sp. FL1777]|nr:hypothetical protein F5Y12DRAFT_580460 [Xylaria sp. FL1777]
MEMGGREKGREITQIPMCANCAIACEDDDRDALLKRALRRVDVADGGLSRQRWKTRSNDKSPHATMTATTRQSQLGGDSSMDMVSSPSPNIPHSPSPTISSSTVEGKEDETMARLHYRRSKDPRFAKLECVVPSGAALYVSIFDPMNTPAFKPSPTKPLPEWMRLLPGGGRSQKKTSQQNNNPRQKEDETRACWSPRSVLDVHFPPAVTLATRRTTPTADNIRTSKMGLQTSELTNHQNGNTDGMEVDYTRARRPLPLASSSSPPSPPISPSPFPYPPLLAMHHRSNLRKSDDSTSSQFSGHLHEGGSEVSHENSSASRKSDSPLSDSGYPPQNSTSSKSPYKRPSIVADEPLQRPSSGLMGLCAYEHRDAKGRGDHEERRAISISTANTTTNLNPHRHRKTDSMLQDNGKGKGKTVAWDKTVAGGESGSDESCEQRPREKESQRQRAESPEYLPKRCSSPLTEQVAAVWHRLVRAQMPPAKSKEFLDLYRADMSNTEEKEKKTRFAHPSLAVPGRRREREIGSLRTCPTCGNQSVY